MMGNDYVRMGLVAAMAILLVTSVSAAPVAADDTVTVGTDGVDVGGDDGVSVESSDSGSGGSVSAEADEDGATVEVEGTSGDSSTSAECEVDDSTDSPCGTASDSDGGTPSTPSTSDESVSVEASDVAPEDPADPVRPVLAGQGETRTEHLSVGGDTLPLITAGLTFGAVTNDAGEVDGVGVGIATSVDNGDQRLSGKGIAVLNPDEGKATVSPMTNVRQSTTEPEPVEDVRVKWIPAGSEVQCDLALGPPFCTMTNYVPVSVGQLPFEEIPTDQLPKAVREQYPGYGLVVLLGDATVAQPVTMAFFLIATAGAEVPASSPVDLTNLPYQPNDLPVDAADPYGSTDPGVAVAPGKVPSANGGGTPTDMRATVNDEVGVRTIGGAWEYGQYRSVGGSIIVSDGQNHHGVTVVATDDSSRPVVVGTDGFIAASVVPSQSQPRAGATADLGGQPYGTSIDDGLPSGPSPQVGLVP